MKEHFMSNDSLDRRDFLKATGAGLSAATTLMGAAKSASKASGRVIGANDRINIGLIGCGGRGRSDANDFANFGKKNKDACQIVAVCDVYAKPPRKPPRGITPSPIPTTANCCSSPISTR